MSTPWRSQKIRRPRAVVRPWVHRIEQRLAPLQVHVCGSWRRGALHVGDLDVLVVTESGELPEDIREKLDFIEFDRGGPTLQNGNIKLPDGDLHVDIYSMAPAHKGAFLWFLTGPMDLNINMRAKAMEKGWMLNQYGLYKQVPWTPVRTVEDDSFWEIVPASDEAYRQMQLMPEDLRAFPTKKAAQAYIDTSLIPSLGKLQIDDGTELSIALHLDCLHLLDPIERQAWAEPKGPMVKRDIVPSSDGTKTYTVTIVSQGDRATVSCTCPGFKFRRKCKHVEGKGTPSSRPT